MKEGRFRKAQGASMKILEEKGTFQQLANSSGQIRRPDDISAINQRASRRVKISSRSRVDVLRVWTNVKIEGAPRLDVAHI